MLEYKAENLTGVKTSIRRTRNNLWTGIITAEYDGVFYRKIRVGPYLQTKELIKGMEAVLKNCFGDYSSTTVV